MAKAPRPQKKGRESPALGIPKARNLPLGTIVTYAGPLTREVAALEKAGWLPCDGREEQRDKYKALATLLGGRFDQGHVAAGKFRLPDLTARVAIGSGISIEQPPESAKALVGLPPLHVGSCGGSFIHRLGGADLAHVHRIEGKTEQVFEHWGERPPRALGDHSGHDHNHWLRFDSKPPSANGDERVIDHTPPFLVLNFLIKHSGR